jgi:hypothetical protein
MPSHHIQTTAIPKAIGRYLFDRIRDLKTIEQFLTATYSRREAFTDELVRVILTFVLVAYCIITRLRSSTERSIVH